MRNIFGFVIFLMLGCTQQHNKVAEWSYYNGKENILTDFDKYNATVLTFLSPECPLSENYSKTLNDLSGTFTKENVRFINVFPGTTYSKVKIDSFIQFYEVKQPFIVDEKWNLTEQLNATITPECFVVNKEGEIIYSGAIDNWAVDLGQKRQVITEFYLRDVLYAVLSGSKIPFNKTTAVGCYIEKQHHH